MKRCPMMSVEFKRILLAILFVVLLAPDLAAREVPRLAAELMSQTVTLELTDRTVGEICEAISESSEIKFVFDDKTDLNKPLNIDLGDMSLEKALDLLMLQTKNFYKPVDERTVLVAPDTRQKRQEYEDQVIQTFYLANADSREIVTLLRSLLQTRQIAESRTQNTVTIKDVTDKVGIAARLVEIADRETGEIAVEFELLEVAKLGEQSAREMSAHSIRNAPGTVSLAHPQMRIISGRSGSIFIGDSVLVPATTACPSGEQPAESVVASSYQNVGIEIDVVPRIGDDRRVTLQLEIGISSVSSEGSQSTPTDRGPVIARRQFETTMRLADGETHIVSSLPALGRSAGGLGDGDPSSTSVSSDTQTELILLVTPRVTRQPHIASDDRRPLWVGTEETMKM
ncbi:MAG: hypothetical protein GY716_15550 [bacterium]|nr:hypothetical protein [bacterium]